MSKEIVGEKDKPFILAVMSGVFTLACILGIMLGGYFNNNSLVEASKEAVKVTLPLTTMAWTFYFSKKEET